MFWYYNMFSKSAFRQKVSANLNVKECLTPCSLIYYSSGILLRSLGEFRMEGKIPPSMSESECGPGLLLWGPKSETHFFTCFQESYGLWSMFYIFPVGHPCRTNMGWPMITNFGEIKCREMWFAPKTESALSVWIWVVTRGIRSLQMPGSTESHSLEAGSKTKAQSETTSTSGEVPMAYRDVLKR